jgi:hypothetical protein
LKGRDYWIRSPSPNRDRDQTSRRSRDRSSFYDQVRCSNWDGRRQSGITPVSNKRNDRSRSRSLFPSRLPSPHLSVGAPAPAGVFPLVPLDRFQCRNFQWNGHCPAHELCFYDHGYQPPGQGRTDCCRTSKQNIHKMALPLGNLPPSRLD